MVYSSNWVYPVSVPIRGLFNLTLEKVEGKEYQKMVLFPSPLGDYLI